MNAGIELSKLAQLKLEKDALHAVAALAKKRGVQDIFSFVQERIKETENLMLAVAQDEFGDASANNNQSEKEEEEWA